MKRLLLIAAICLAAVGAKAEMHFKSLNNIHGTNVVIVDNDAPATISITDAVLFNDGREYPAKEIRCDVQDGTATYKLKFKRFTIFKDTRVTLTVNGRKVTVDLKKFM